MKKAILNKKAVLICVAVGIVLAIIITFVMINTSPQGDCVPTESAVLCPA